MSFPGEISGFPHPVKTRRRARRRRPGEVVPQGERTHVAVSRFLLACGARRLSIDRERVVLENPSCPSCASELYARAAREAFVRGETGEKGAVDW